MSEEPAGARRPWSELKEPLARLLDADAAERARLLAEHRESDPELARELGELVRADGVSESFLDRGATPLVAADGVGADAAADFPSLEGLRLGAWRLGAALGRGGMGVVYRAARADGAFEQAAAIKILRRSVDTPEFQRRFVRERQLLATLDHPAIVKVLDGGVTADGLPWYALELVEGESITRFAAARSLSNAERVRLLTEVCEAVEAAHRRLVVHRDLKPSNILVSADGRVKLLDFGIAKLLDPKEEGETQTRTEMRLLTPQYAAPEQILGEPVTTAVDVYALGVVLFELLTGSVPHRRTTSTPAGLARDVALESAVPPSRRLLLEPTADAETRRRARELQGDLDAIALRALRPEAAERYGSVAAFADDLRRYLDRRPVAARRGDRLYRTRKFVLRHGAGVAAALVALVAVMGGGVVATYEARVARDERDEARVQAETARRVSDFLVHLFQQADPAKTRGAQLTAREVLAAGARRIERELAGEPQIQASLRLAIGSVERDLGLYQEAQPLLEGALAERRRRFGPEHLATAEAEYELGSLDRFLDRLDEGRTLLASALRIRERELGPDHMDVARARSALGVVLRFQGNAAASRTEFERALEIAAKNGVANDETGRWQNNLGLVLADLGDNPGAEASYRRSIEQLERSAGPDNPLLALPLDNLGSLLTAAERFDEASPVLERALPLVQRTWGEKHTQYGNALNSLARLRLNQKRCDEAIPMFEHAAAIYASALGPEHPWVAFPLLNEADCLFERGDAKGALAANERALAIREKSAEGKPDAQVAQSLGRIGSSLAALGRFDEAEGYLRRALAMSRATWGHETAGVGEAIVDLADFLVKRGAKDEALTLYDEALEIFRKLYPGGHSFIDRVTAARARLGAAQS